MNLYDKLEEIRNKPEHIRRRYVWVAVAISMAFVLLIWFFSLKEKQVQDTSLMDSLRSSDLPAQVDAGKQQLQNIQNGIKNAAQNQGRANDSNINNNQ